MSQRVERRGWRRERARGAWVLALALLAACGDSTTPPPPEDAGAADAPFVPTDDRDGDGLCDGTEIMRGTDPDVADTDLDGFPDYAEVLLGTNPSLNTSPDRETVFTLRERAEAAIDIPLQQSVFGNGEDYTGSFEALGTPDEAGETATDFYGGGRATFAEPPENVALIDVDEEAFRGVVGRTLLGFELRFVRGASPTRGCIRAHLFRYNVKRSDGRLVGAQRNLLVVLPPSTSLETGEWCRPSSGCL